MKDSPEFLAQYLLAFEKNDCQFMKTARELDVENDSVTTWRKLHPEFNASIKKLQGLLNERMERNLLNMANDGNIVANIFYLKNNWREKYADKQQMEVTPSQLWFEPRELPTTELTKLGSGE